MRQAIGILTVVLLLHSCKRERCTVIEGPRKSRIQMVHPVTAISLNMVANLRLELDTIAPYAEVIAQEEVHEEIDFHTTGDALAISLKSCIKEHEEIIMNTFLREVRSLEITSAGEIASSSLIAEDTLDLFNRGLGDIDLVLHVNRVGANIHSSGDILLSGEAKRLDLYSTASGDLKAFNLVADTVSLKINGPSVIEVYTDGILNIEFLRKATVSYRGTPLEINVKGNGTVADANL